MESGDFKRELYASAAFLCGRVVDRACAERPSRPPFGLIGSETLRPPFRVVESLNPEDPFADLKACMQSTLLVALDQELRYLDSLVADRAEPAGLREEYLRFKQLSASPESWFHPGPRGFIGAGINTGIDVMAKVLRVIPEVADRRESDDLLAIARNSYHLVVALSMRHIRDFAVTTRALESGTDGARFDPGRFVLRRSASGPALGIAGAVSPDEPPAGFTSSFGEEDPAVGCPAMVSFGGASAIRKLWAWHLDIAAAIYHSVDRRVAST